MMTPDGVSTRDTDGGAIPARAPRQRPSAGFAAALGAAMAAPSRAIAADDAATGTTPAKREGVGASLDHLQHTLEIIKS